jgi:hypothetical protein
MVNFTSSSDEDAESDCYDTYGRTFYFCGKRVSCNSIENCARAVNITHIQQKYVIAFCIAWYAENPMSLDEFGRLCHFTDPAGFRQKRWLRQVDLGRVDVSSLSTLLQNNLHIQAITHLALGRPTNPSWQVLIHVVADLPSWQNLSIANWPVPWRTNFRPDAFRYDAADSWSELNSTDENRAKAVDVAKGDL